ncbi:MAG: membrane dipeptidase, partial [Phenylobacterium sp.]
MTAWISRRAVLAGTAAGLAAAPALAQDAALDARARQIHDRVLVLDSHADVPNDFGVGPHEAGVDGDSQVDLPKLRRGGVDAAVLAAFAPQGPRTPEGVTAAWKITDAKLSAITAVPQSHPDQAVLALTPDAALAARKAGKVAVVPSFLNAHALGRDVAAIDDLHRRGVRVFGFVHAGNN